MRSRVIPIRSRVIPIRSRVIPIRSRVIPMRSRVIPMRSRVVPMRSRVIPIRSRPGQAEPNRTEEADPETPTDFRGRPLLRAVNQVREFREVHDHVINTGSILG
jgi:hypothetical protein